MIHLKKYSNGQYYDKSKKCFVSLRKVLMSGETFRIGRKKRKDNKMVRIKQRLIYRDRVVLDAEGKEHTVKDEYVKYWYIKSEKFLSPSDILDLKGTVKIFDEQHRDITEYAIADLVLQEIEQEEKNETNTNS